MKSFHSHATKHILVATCQDLAPRPSSKKLVKLLSTLGFTLQNRMQYLEILLFWNVTDLLSFLFPPLKDPAFDFVFSLGYLDLILLAVVVVCFYFVLDARHINLGCATRRGPVNPIGDGDGSKPAPSHISGAGNGGNHGQRGRGRGANPRRGCPRCHLDLCGCHNRQICSVPSVIYLQCHNCASSIVNVVNSVMMLCLRNTFILSQVQVMFYLSYAKVSIFILGISMQLDTSQP